MAEQLSPGVVVEEVTKGPAVITPTNSLSIGAFLGVTEKGTPRVPKKISSFAEFVAFYGKARTDSYMYESVELFFKNGGKICWISRAAHFTTITDPTTFDMTAAYTMLQDAAPVNTLKVEASSPGAWGKELKVTSTRKSRLLTTVVGSLAASPTTSATLTNASQVKVGDLLQITDGSDSITVTVLTKNGNVVTFASVTPGGVISPGSVYLLTFDLKAIDRDGNVINVWTDLRMSALSSRYVETIVNNTYASPFTVTDQASATADPRPADTTSTTLSTAGSDGSSVAAADYNGSSSGKTGIYAFDTVKDFGMLSIPGVTTTSVMQTLVDYAESRKTFLAQVELPVGTTVSGAVTAVQTTINRYSSYAEVLFPWLKALSPLDGSVQLVPPSGARQGIIAKTDASRGPWKPAAGEVDGRIAGVTGVELEVIPSDYDTLYPARINAFLVRSGVGLYFNGNVTLDPTGEFIETSVRRLFLHIEVSIRDGSGWVNMEVNNTSTRNRFKRNIEGFLESIRQKGGLEGNTPSQAYFVICDESNNTLAVRQARKLLARVGAAPVHAAEFAGVTVEQDTRAADAAAANTLP